MYIYVPYSYLDGKNHGKIHGFRFSDFPNQWVGQGRVTNQPEMSIIFFAGDQREIDGLVREIWTPETNPNVPFKYGSFL